MLHDVLSVWEVAHRWHEHDPNLTDPTALPLPVQDTLRLITRLLAGHDLATCSAQGVEYWNRGQMLSFETFCAQFCDPADQTEEAQWTAYEDYQEHFEKKITRHDAAVADLDQCYIQRHYDKARLDQVYVTRHAIESMCQSLDLELPRFWFPEGTAQATRTASAGPAITEPDKAPRPSHIDKQLCQAIAQTLWEIYPDMTIAALTGHKAIQLYGNGKHYKGKDTLRNWVREVDPCPENRRRGRPKKGS